MPLTRRWLPALATVGAFVTTPAFAQAPASRSTCGEAYVNGQHLLRDRKLLEARALLLVCARPPCAAAIQPECAGWLEEAERAIPSVVLGAHDASGTDLLTVSVQVDGKPFAERLDGAALEIDPGPHVFRMEAAGHRPAEVTVVVREGEKSRLVGALLEDDSAAHPSVVAMAPPSRVPAYLFGGVGAATAATFAYFGAAGLVLRGQLASCRGSCPQSKVDQGDADWVGADVSLGISLVSLGLATYFFLRARPTGVKTASAPRLVITPSRGGGVAGVGGVF